MREFALRAKSRESDVEIEVVAWAENNGWVVRKMQYIGRRGCADRFFFGYGQIVMLEFKRLDDGIISENQSKEHARLEAVGCPVFVFYTSQSAIDFLKRKM
jgi:hypothetical protein